MNNFIVGGNKLVGIEVSMSDLAEDRMPKIQNALVIGELKSEANSVLCPLT